MQENLSNVKLPSPKSSNAAMSSRGRSHRFPMELVHLNKKEADHLDKIQGGRVMRHGTRSYAKLGHHFMDPHFVNKFEESGRSLLAKGGMAKIQSMRKKGRFGDTEVAYMPKHVADRLDRMIGGRCQNPLTGKREYFFGSLLSGLGAAARAAVPAIGRGIMTAGKAIAPHIGTIANVAGNVVPAALALKQQHDMMKAQQAAGQAPQTDANGQPITMQNTLYNSGLNSLLQGLQAKASGASTMDAMKAGAQSGMNSFQNSDLMKNAMDQYGQNQQQSQGAPSRFQQMADRVAPAINAGREAYNTYRDTGNVQDSLVRGGYRGATDLNDRYGGQYQKPISNIMRSGMQGYDEGGMRGGMQRAGMRGMEEGMNRIPNQNMRAGVRSAYNTYQDTGDMGQAAMRGAGTYAGRQGYGDMREGFNSAANARGQGMNMGNVGMQGTLGALNSYARRRFPDDDYGDSMRNMYGDDDNF